VGSIEIICANVFQLYGLWYKVGKTCCKKMIIDLCTMFNLISIESVRYII
jgi:hypothetical protein